MRTLVFVLAFLAVAPAAYSDDSKFESLNTDCFAANKQACVAAGKIASKKKEYRTAADLFIRGCTHGSAEACNLQVSEEAKDGNFEGYLSAMTDACSAGVKKYCSMTDSAKLSSFESFQKAAEPDLAKDWEESQKERARESLKQAKEEAKQRERERAANKLKSQCESGRNASCLVAGKALLAESSYSEALEVFEKACDRKNGEACELAGIAAGSDGRSDYALTLLQLGCKLGRVSSCRLEGKIGQIRADRQRQNAEQYEIQRRQEEENRARLNRQIAEEEAIQNAANALGNFGNSLRQMQGPRVDFNCVNRCTASGSMLDFCNSKCAY